MLKEIDLTHEEVTELAEEIDEPEMLGIKEDEANIDLPNQKSKQRNEVDAPETFANSQEELSQC